MTLIASIQPTRPPNKAEAIRAMLQHWHHAHAAANNQGPGHAGNASRILEMDTSWTPEYQQLENLLRALRANEPTVYWHVRERYIASTLRRLEIPVRKGKYRLPRNSELYAGQTPREGRAVIVIRSWNPLVNEKHVEQGIRWIAVRFHGVPRLPREMMVA